MSETIIKLDDVWKIYKLDGIEIPALRGLSIEVKKGEFVAIMGPSGSGKSTALQAIGCLDVPTKGTIMLEHKDISHLDESTLAQIRGRKIGFIFQQFNLIQTLTALENVMLPMIFQAIPEKERFERAKSLLNLVGLSQRMYNKPNQCSGGEQQRIAIARALANDPEIILADEPTGNLDSKSGFEIMETLKDLNKQGKTIVLITHDQSLSKYAERVICIKDGKVEQITIGGKPCKPKL